MTKFLVTLEIIVDNEDKLFMSEIETAMHKMVRSVKTVNIYDYGLDLEPMN